MIFEQNLCFRTVPEISMPCGCNEQELSAEKCTYKATCACTFFSFCGWEGERAKYLFHLVGSLCQKLSSYFILPG